MMQYVFNALATLSIAVMGWVATLGNRVTALEVKQVDTNRVTALEVKQIDTKELIFVRLDSIDNRLSRIERTLNGNLVKE